MKCNAIAGQLFFSHTYEFLGRYLPLQVGRSPHTVESYRDALSAFRRFALEERGLSAASMTFGDCDRDLVLSFLEYMAANGLAPGTRNQRLAALKSYVWYAAGRDVTLQSVAIAVSHIPPVKDPGKVKDVLTEAALAAMLSQPDPSTPMGARDRAILILFYDSAIRLSELIGLDVGDVFFNDPRIFVTGKGSKERMVALTEATASHLAVHVSCFHGSSPDPSAPLFYTRSRGGIARMSPSNLQRLVQKYADLARVKCSEVPDKVHPHVFRRTRATNLYQSGVPLELVSRILGHSSIETTKAYAKPSTEMLRNAMEAAYPGDVEEASVWVGREDELAKMCGLR